jgi:hypothetical protein
MTTTTKAVSLRDLIGEISRDADGGVVAVGPSRWADASGKRWYFIVVYKRRQLFYSMMIDDNRASDRDQFVAALSSIKPKLILHTFEYEMTTECLRVMARREHAQDRIRLVRG